MLWWVKRYRSQAGRQRPYMRWSGKKPVREGGQASGIRKDIDRSVFILVNAFPDGRKCIGSTTN